MRKVCIVRSNPNDDISKILKERHYNVYGLYRGYKNIFLRCIRRFWLKYHLPFSFIWFDNSILKNDSKRILVFESLTTQAYIKWLTEKKKDADIAIWYWNIVKNTIHPKEINDLRCTLWSFSRMDCKEYG